MGTIVRPASQLTDRHKIHNLAVESVEIDGDTVHVQFICGGQAQFGLDTRLDVNGKPSGPPNWQRRAS